MGTFKGSFPRHGCQLSTIDNVRGFAFLLLMILYGSEWYHKSMAEEQGCIWHVDLKSKRLCGLFRMLLLLTPAVTLLMLKAASREANLRRCTFGDCSNAMQMNHQLPIRSICSDLNRFLLVALNQVCMQSKSPYLWDRGPQFSSFSSGYIPGINYRILASSDVIRTGSKRLSACGTFCCSLQHSEEHQDCCMT